MKLYHGTPKKINDKYFASGTFFSEDINIARSYGDVIYELDILDRFVEGGLLVLDVLNEHYVSTRLIPLDLTIIIKKEMR